MYIHKILTLIFFSLGSIECEMKSSPLKITLFLEEKINLNVASDPEVECQTGSLLFFINFDTHSERINW